MITVNEIIEKIQTDNIGLLEFWFVDLLGNIKSVAIPVGNEENRPRLKQILEHGTLCDIASLIPAPLIGGQSPYQKQYQNAVIRPDLTTYLALPWTFPNSSCRDILQKQAGNYSHPIIAPTIAKARLMCDIAQNQESTCFSSRKTLKDYLTTFSKESGGWRYIVGPELEFHYFKDDKSVFDQGSYLDTEPNTEKTARIREITALLCEAIGIKVECHHHEVGHAQQEIDFVKTEALTMADNIMTYKLIARDVAKLFGVNASFMPKPFTDAHGNGMHVHQSIWEGENNLFYAEDRNMKLSSLAESFSAGLLVYSSEITAITNQWINSYKRIVPSFEAPVYIAWGSANRSTLIRIPRHYPAANHSVRIEYRSPDPACNPYLVFTVMLAAGMAGKKDALKLPPEVRENIYEMPQPTIKQHGIGTLPANLGQALTAMKNGTIVKEALGDKFMQDFLKIKEADWMDFNHHVSEFEIREMRKLGV